MVSYFELRELLTYDSEEGLFRWAVARGFKKQGTPASKQRITINGKVYSAGKLAWFYTYCQWPNKRFRYVDGDCSNIRLSNLTQEPIKRTKPKRMLDFWVRMTKTQEGYKVEITQKHAAPTDLGEYKTYEEAAAVQRMALACSL